MKFYDQHSFKIIAFCFWMMLSFVSGPQIFGQAKSTKEILATTGIIFYQDSIILDDHVGYYTFVLQVLPNTPGSTTDITYKDKLFSINGIQIGHERNDFEKANRMMQGENGTSVNIELERNSAYKVVKRINYTVERKLPNSVVKSKIFGIGVTLLLDSIRLDDAKKYAAKIQTVYEGSPAANAGINAGDFILAVDEHQIDGTKTDVLIQIINYLLIDEPNEAHLMLLRKTEQGDSILNINLLRVDISDYIKIGQSTMINQPGIKQPEPIVPVKSLTNLNNDLDEDGIENSIDACPEIKGVYSINPYLNGCPEK